MKKNNEDYIELAKSRIADLLKLAKLCGIDRLQLDEIETGMEDERAVHFLEIFPATDQDRESYPNINYGHNAATQFFEENGLFKDWMVWPEDVNGKATYSIKRKRGSL